jgi:BON domain
MRMLLPVAVTLFLASPALAQMTGGTGGGSLGGSLGSSSLGGSSGTFTGSSSGTFTGSSGTFTGSSSGTFTGSTTTGRTGSLTGGAGGLNSSSTINTANPLYQYEGNPLAAGLPTTTNNNSSQYLRQFPSPLSFATPLYNLSGTSGRGGVGGSVGSLSGSGTASISSTTFRGANTFGTPRVPVYMAELAFERAPRPAGAVRSNVQDVIARSTRLPSRDRIRVSMEGNVVVLQGQVSGPREKRLAESVIRLTPGVYEVRNDLIVPPGSNGSSP